MDNGKETRTTIITDGESTAMVTATTDPAAAQLYLDALDVEACDQARALVGLAPADDGQDCSKCRGQGFCGLA